MPPPLTLLCRGTEYRLNATAVGFYRESSSAIRAGTLRNGANALQGIALLHADIAPLVAFLKSLNEDYQ